MAPVSAALVGAAVALSASLVNVALGQGRLVFPRPILGTDEFRYGVQPGDFCGVQTNRGGAFYDEQRKWAMTVTMNTTYNFLYRVSDVYGGGPLSVYVDPAGKGAAFASTMPVGQNVPGDGGILTYPTEGKFPAEYNISVTIPMGVTCTGKGKTCLVLVRNSQGVSSCVFMKVLQPQTQPPIIPGGSATPLLPGGYIANPVDPTKLSVLVPEPRPPVPRNPNHSEENEEVDPSDTVAYGQLQLVLARQRRLVISMLKSNYEPNDMRPQIAHLVKLFLRIPAYERTSLLPFSQVSLSENNILQLDRMVPKGLVPAYLVRHAKAQRDAYYKRRRESQSTKPTPTPVSAQKSTRSATTKPTVVSRAVSGDEKYLRFLDD